MCDPWAFTEAHPSTVQTQVLQSILLGKPRAPHLPGNVLRSLHEPSYLTLLRAQRGGTTTIIIISLVNKETGME